MRRESDLALTGLPARVNRLELDMKANTVITQQVYENTRTLIEGIEAASSFWTFMSLWVGRFRRWSYALAKWVGVVAVAVSAVWAATKVVFGADLSHLIVDWWRAR